MSCCGFLISSAFALLCFACYSAILLVLGMGSATELSFSESFSGDSPEELWALVPSAVRLGICPHGFPDVEILDAFCLDDADRCKFLLPFAADAEELHMLSVVLRQRRRARVDCFAI